jgi:hypothetical protein
MLVHIYIYPKIGDKTIREAIHSEIPENHEYILLNKTTDKGWMILHINQEINNDIIKHINIASSCYILTYNNIDKFAKMYGINDWKTETIY